MNFYRRSELTPKANDFLAHYDATIRSLVGESYAFPIRMRDWELCRVLDATAGLSKDARILDTGSFNTYLGLYLSRQHSDVTVSDLMSARRRKSFLRRLGLAPTKPTEAGYAMWCELMKANGLKVRDVDLTRIPYPNDSFDCIISLSVIEHVPATEQALAELYRVLAPGGRLLITTDCSQDPKPYSDNVRYFTQAEMNTFFGPYPVTSMRNEPDFARENWCYGGKQAVVTSFVQITKPR